MRSCFTMYNESSGYRLTVYLNKAKHNARRMFDDGFDKQSGAKMRFPDLLRKNLRQHSSFSLRGRPLLQKQTIQTPHDETEEDSEADDGRQFFIHDFEDQSFHFYQLFLQSGYRTDFRKFAKYRMLTEFLNRTSRHVKFCFSILLAVKSFFIDLELRQIRSIDV